jgi:hypothetical protein
MQVLLANGTNGTNHTGNGTEAWEVAVFAATGSFSLVTVIATIILIYGHLRYW